MSIIDNPYSKYKPAKDVEFTPLQWKAYRAMRTYGSFMDFDLKRVVQEMIDEGLLEEARKGRGYDTRQQKIGRGTRKRPDIIYRDNKIVGKEYSITRQYSNGSTATGTGKLESMTEWVFDRKAVSLTPYFDIKRIPQKAPFIWLRPMPYVRCIKKKTIVSADYIPAPNVVAFDVHMGSMATVITGAFWNSTNIPAAVRNEALLKFHEKVLDQKVDLMTFAAEGKSSLNMIADAMDDLLKIYKSVRSGNVRRANSVLRSRGMRKPKKISKRPDERWLQYQYGWAPLIGDISSAVSAIADGEETPHLFSVGSGVKFQPSAYNDSVHTESAMAEYKVKCYYALGPNPKARTMAQWNLLSNPLLTAWELVPYSFVIDWIVPIGDFVAQYASTDGLVFISGTESISVNYSATLQSKVRFSAAATWVDVDRRIREDTFYYERKVLTRTPFASFPPFKPGASLRRMFSAISLLTVNIKSKPNR